MKSTTKRILALILAICCVFGVMMPSVFAAGDAGADAGAVTPEGSDTSELNIVKYDLAGWYSHYNANTFIFAGDAVRAEAQPIQDAYASGESNWKIETGTVTQARLMSTYLRVDTVKAKTGSQTYFAIRIKSPGEGKYKLNLSYIHSNYSSSPEMDYGNVFILPAPETPYTKSTLASALSGQTPVLELTYDSEDPASSAGAAATKFGEAYRFEADKEYIVVFGGKELTAVTTESCAYMYLSSFTLEVDPTPDPEPAEPVVYDFYSDDWADAGIRSHIPEIKAAYDEGALNWRYEMASSAYQFRIEGDVGNTAANKNGSNVFSGGAESLTYATGVKGWVALRFRSPGAGRYDLTLTHGALPNGATACISITSGREYSATVCKVQYIAVNLQFTYAKISSIMTMRL